MSGATDTATLYGVEQLEERLERLKLNETREHLEAILQEAAKRELNYREFLALVCQREGQAREVRRLEMGVKLAGFPFVKTLEGFDFDAQPGVDPGRIRDLAACRWVEHADNLLLLGPPGVGKTHLAVALGREAILRGARVVFRQAAPLLGELVRAQQEGALERKLKQLCKPRVLIVDELGYLPLERQGSYLFFQLIARRYEKGSVILTSNRSVQEWGEVFGDAVVATAILDRLLHHSHIVTIRGDSYRLREKRKAGLLKAPLPDPGAASSPSDVSS